MNYILFDSKKERTNLLPFTFTRPVAGIRIGILTVAEKWEKHLGKTISYKTQDYLQEKFSIKISNQNILINGSVCPNKNLIAEINALKKSQALVKGDVLIAACVDENNIASFDEQKFDGDRIETKLENILHVEYCHSIFSKNAQAIEEDFELLTKGRKSQAISSTNGVVNKERIFIEENAKVEFSILNATDGPIYIAENSEVMEGCKIRGPFALCSNASLKMGAKIYGATTVGPYCKVGGELNNSVLFSYSNKGHDGFLGNSVIGEWCNLGADTNNSNLKNTYDEVKLWNYGSEKFDKTGLTFCGLMMADHAKCGINSMFNTGTVIGVGANVFGSGFPRNFIPDFAWGGAQGYDTFVLNKFFTTAEMVCKRRNVSFDGTEKNILSAVFDETKKYRFWEK